MDLGEFLIKVEIIIKSEIRGTFDESEKNYSHEMANMSIKPRIQSVLTGHIFFFNC